MKNQFNTPENLAGAILTVDLRALQANWRELAKQAAPADCGAAIKGDAYGLGVGPVAHALWEAGCKTYFVARPKEGEELRGLLPDAIIYVLDGLYSGQSEYYAVHNLRPALISVEEAQEWLAFGRTYGHKLPCAIHVDTGINRLGFSVSAFASLLQDEALRDGLSIALLMSHLACSDEPTHPLNIQQAKVFAIARALLPTMHASFANSSGIYLGTNFVHDLVRPGIALYGGNPLPGQQNPMQVVASLEGRVMQVRNVNPQESVGYSATWVATEPSRIAILGAGYRDGIPRALSSKPNTNLAHVFLGGRRCPIIGRVSMDMMAVDISALPEGAINRGARAEIFGANISVDEVASWAGTISYELLTHLGSRYARVYLS